MRKLFHGNFQLRYGSGRADDAKIISLQLHWGKTTGIGYENSFIVVKIYLKSILKLLFSEINP